MPSKIRSSPLSIHLIQFFQVISFHGLAVATGEILNPAGMFRAIPLQILKKIFPVAKNILSELFIEFVEKKPCNSIKNLCLVYNFGPIEERGINFFQLIYI